MANSESLGRTVRQAILAIIGLLGVTNTLLTIEGAKGNANFWTILLTSPFCLPATVLFLVVLCLPRGFEIEDEPHDQRWNDLVWAVAGAFLLLQIFGSFHTYQWFLHHHRVSVGVITAFCLHLGVGVFLTIRYRAFLPVKDAA